MSEAQGHGRGADGSAKPSKRDALIEAAFELFTAHGFEQTTVDDIVRLAGVGRSSFFRHFPSKEDVVFPDHEGCLAEMTIFLQEGSGTEDPVIRVCDAARLVMRMYAGNPSFAVQRYRLTKSVPGLRHHELSVVWRYERTLADYLRRRFAHRPDGTLRADVIAASVVAAHNNALRTWLRSAGQEDPSAHMDHALRFVQNSWGPEGEARSADEEDTDDVVVLITKRKAPMWRVVRGIEATLDDR
ncbi:TetR family transcriptional regulator [Streptomyces antimycoticus]|uniref:TetR family transcriptional regulator n=1 Tax=Streptomyces antimycoticus TaxID=68175 RepID=A0A4D4KQR0_9ACTN|nr:TetR/AcrR family transcriptional regulator [Streptomyces antimycoticus]GDY48209.1 TetR family transcriptional regulator [Streptomyces antimycoticus]